MVIKEYITLLELHSFSSTDRDQFVLPSVYFSSVPTLDVWERRLLEPIHIYQYQCSIGMIKACIEASGVFQHTSAPDMMFSRLAYRNWYMVFLC
jgi:hypothetical protein